MPQFCTGCGTAAEPGKNFCTVCGAKIEAAEPVLAGVAAPAQQPAQPPPPPPPAPSLRYPVQPRAAQAAMPGPAYPYMPPVGTGPELISMFGYIGWLILMGLPVLGLVLSIVMGMNKTPTNRRNLAKAMIVFNVIGLIFTVIFAVMMYSILSQLSEVADISFSLFGFELFK